MMHTVDDVTEELDVSGLRQYTMLEPPRAAYLRTLVAQSDPGGQWSEFGWSPTLDAARCMEAMNILEDSWRRAFGKDGVGPIVPMLVPGSTANDFRLELPLETAIALIGADAYITVSAQTEGPIAFMLRRAVGNDAYVNWHVNPSTLSTIQIPLLSDTDELGGHLYFADELGTATRARRRAGCMIYYSGSVVRAETRLAPGARQYALFIFT